MKLHVSIYKLVITRIGAWAGIHAAAIGILPYLLFSLFIKYWQFVSSVQNILN
jgi:hypothetical protein